jgi:hypothetical protein
MRKIIIATAATLGVVAAVGLPTATAAGKTRHFTLTAVGLSEGVVVVHGPGGYRAVELETHTSENYQPAVGGGGTGRMTLFDARGTILFAERWTSGKLQGNGVVPVTGTARSIRGTGIYRHVKETFTFTSFDDVKIGRATGTQRVTQTL